MILFIRHTSLILVIIFLSISFKLSESSSKSTDNDPYFSKSHEKLKNYINNYIWPTDASEKVTSSFAEYRTGHFHGGIDISTNGITGYRVFAVADGFIDRIRIQANGYGKMLIIRHNDGFYSTYAHLKNFNDIIEKIVHKEQLRNGIYQIDMILDSSKIPVKKGNIIAYTGDTGFGPAHLHFELRDPLFNPINPLIGNSFAVDDKIKPIIRKIIIKPLSYFSTIDGKKEEKHFSRFPKHNNVLNIPQAVKIYGKIGFGVDVTDRSDGSWSKNGIHRIEMYLDDSLCYSMELNIIPYELTNQIDIHYDISSIIDGYGRFQKLYVDNGNSLPFYNPSGNESGIIDTENIPEGIHTYRIVCYDIANNYSELRGTLLADSRPGITLFSIDENTIKIKSSNNHSFSKILLEGKRSYQPNWIRHTLNKNRFDNEGSLIVIPINKKPYDVFKIVGYTEAGSETEPLYHFIKKPAGPVRVLNTDFKYLDDGVEMILTTPGVFTEPPEVIVHEGFYKNKIILKPTDLSKYTGIYFPNSKYQGERRFLINAEINGVSVSDEKNIKLYVIPDNEKGTFKIQDYNVIVSYDSASVYKPIYFSLKKNSDEGAPLFSFEPKDILIKTEINFSIPVAKISDVDHAGLFYRSTGGWLFQTKELSENKLYFKTAVKRMLGEFAIFHDITPPTIGRLRTSIQNRYLSVSFRYHDNLSGVNPDDIKMYIDDSLIIPEIDGEHRKVICQSNERLSKGKHTLKIIIQDRMKNRSEITRQISVR